LSLGGRIEHNNYSGIELQPEVRLAWEPKRGHTLWFALARGVRPPTPLEADARGEFGEFVPTGQAPVKLYLADNPEIRSEAVRAVETGYRGDLSAKLSVDLAAYTNSYTGLRSVKLAGFSPGAPTRLYVKFDDQDSGRVAGSGKQRRMAAPELLEVGGQPQLDPAGIKRGQRPAVTHRDRGGRQRPGARRPTEELLHASAQGDI
jgi:outer membrane receptor protein involved in Fe transport